MIAKYHNGAFAFTRNSATIEPMFPDQIARIAAQFGIRETIIPSYAGDRAVVSRAISTQSTALAKQGWWLRPLKQFKTHLVYGIVREEKNQEERRLRHDHEACFEWNVEHDNGLHVTGTHEAALAVDQQYQDYRGKIMAPDWTNSIMTYLIGDCHAQAMRDDGRVVWIPPVSLPQVYDLKPFLEAVGITMAILVVEAEHTIMVQQATTESIAGQLQALQEEVAAFDGTQKPSTYKARIVAYQALRKRATLYRETLGIGVEQAENLLQELEEKVRGLLEIRSKTTIHRDTKARKSDQPLEAAEVTAPDPTDPLAAVTGF